MLSMLDKILQAILKMLKKKDERVLLWKNASPTSDFNAQTITLPDLKNYPMYEVVYYPIRGEDSRDIAFGIPGYACYLKVVTAQATGRRFISRSLDDKTKLAFGQGRYANTDGGAYEIPIEIYGIKFSGGGKLVSIFRKLLVRGGGRYGY